MQFRVIIPVRMGAQRLPNKPLLPINGMPMIQHTYNVATQSGAVDAIIATDSHEIAEVCRDFGAPVCMTSPDHKTGSERIAEAVEALGFDEEDIIVNLQGDEPLMPAGIIHQVAHVLDVHDNAKIATICRKITDNAAIFDPHVVKVVFNKRNQAMYFSRAAIPWERDNFSEQPIKSECSHYHHIGIYAYRVGFLQEYLRSMPCDIELYENLEQLRILWHGHRIHMCTTDIDVPKGVDTQADLDRVRSIMGS